MLLFVSMVSPGTCGCKDGPYNGLKHNGNCVNGRMNNNGKNGKQTAHRSNPSRFFIYLKQQADNNGRVSASQRLPRTFNTPTNLTWSVAGIPAQQDSFSFRMNNNAIATCASTQR